MFFRPPLIPLIVSSITPRISSASAARQLGPRPQPAQHVHLEVVQGIDVGIAQLHRLQEDRLAPEDLLLAGERENRRLGPGKLGLEQAEDPAPDPGLLDQPGIQGGDAEVGLAHRQLGVVDQGLEERPVPVHLPQQLPGGRSAVQLRGQGAAEPKPARKIKAALHPGKDPGDGAQVSHAFGVARR